MKKSSLIALLTLCLVLPSCGVSTSADYGTNFHVTTSTGERQKYTKANLNVKVFNTITENRALASKQTSLDHVCILSKKIMFYDGLSLSGTFVLVGTYSYTTVEYKSKTVPVYIPMNEFRTYLSGGGDLEAFLYENRVYHR